MYKKHRQLCLLIISFFLIITFNSCNNKYQGTFEVIKYHFSENKWPCVVKFEDKNYFVIDYIRKYNDGKLVSYQGCASEGIYTDDFEKNGEYSKEDEEVKQLLISKKKNQINFFNKIYNIQSVNKDSIYVKLLDKDEYYIFIGNIPE
jgi:hypothetical protein